MLSGSFRRWLLAPPFFASVAALVFAFSSTALKPRLVQDGCDSPAHLLLSESWLKAPRQTGSPALRQELARSLSGQGFTLEQYSRSLGPLCTHWNGVYQLNQYPPGLPAALSLAPFEIRGLWYGTIVFLIFLRIGLRLQGRAPARTSAFLTPTPGPMRDRGDLFLPVLAVSPLVLPVLFPYLVSLHGMAVCFGLITLLVVFCLEEEPSGWRTGLLAGLCLLVRYDTLLPLAALGLALASRRMPWRFWGAALAAATATGVAPLMIYQKYVSGTPWRPVAPSYDLAWATGAREILGHALSQLAWFNLRFGALWLLGVIFFRPPNPRERALKTAWIAASALGFGIVCAKQVQTSYYLWPWAAMGFGFFLVGVARVPPPVRARAAFTAIILLWALGNTVSGARVQTAQAREYRRLARGITETWPRRPRAWIVAGSSSAFLDAMRIHLGLGKGPVVVDGVETPPEVRRAIDAVLSRERVPVYRFDPESGTILPTTDGG